MANKLLTVIVAVIVVVAVVAAAVVVLDDGENGETTYEFDDLQLMVYGNANKDFTINEQDRDLIQSIIDGEVQDAMETYPFADVNNDGEIDESDLTAVDSIIDREPGTVNVACVDREGNDVVKSIQYPLDNIAVVGVGAITASLCTNAGDEVVTYASFPVSYANAYSALGGTSFNTTGANHDWSIFVQVDQETPVDAMFIDYQYAGFLTDNEYESLDLGSIPYLIYKVSSPNAHTSAAVTMGFLCGEETEAVGYQFASDTYDVLAHIQSVVGDMSDEEKATFITLARSTSISQNHHANNDVGIIGGGIPYYQTNPEFAALYEGTGTDTSPADALAQYQDADAYISITSKDFGADPHDVVIDLMEPASGTDPLVFFHGVEDRWYYINNLLPGAMKAAYAAEAMYPDLFEGYGDRVAQEFIDAGYSLIAGQTVDSLAGFLTYQDYLDAKGEAQA